MARVVAGVKRVNNGGMMTLPDEPAYVAMRCYWLRIGDVVLRTEDAGLISAEVTVDANPLIVTVKLYADEFRTVDQALNPNDV